MISQGSLFTGSITQRKLDYICLLNIFLIFNLKNVLLRLAVSHQVQLVCDLLLTYKMSISCFSSFSRYKTFGNPGIQLVKSTWGYISRPRILPVIEFGMRSPVLQYFSFQTVLRKRK